VESILSICDRRGEERRDMDINLSCTVKTEKMKI
jgi:hypothetical protein